MTRPLSAFACSILFGVLLAACPGKPTAPDPPWEMIASALNDVELIPRPCSSIEIFAASDWDDTLDKPLPNKSPIRTFTTGTGSKGCGLVRIVPQQRKGFDYTLLVEYRGGIVISRGESIKIRCEQECRIMKRSVRWLK